MIILLGVISCSSSQIDKDTGETVVTQPQAIIPAVCPENEPTAVMTTNGCVLGISGSGRDSFFNVPYAKAPVGELRWKRPLHSDSWEEPLDGTTVGDYCIQYTEMGLAGSEDCLNLNILRPEGSNSDSNLPILFFTHGGSYTSGSGSMDTYITDARLADNAIVVTHNYRLGALGFLAHPALSSEDGEENDDSGSSGNQGLFDTLMALQWTVDNAQALGGNPEQLMIFGESAGGMTTCSLLASPLAEGLFSAALIQSAGCIWLNQDLSNSTFWGESAEEQGLRLASSLDCQGNQEETLQCMREKDEAEIFSAMINEAGFGPNVDDVFLVGMGIELFARGEFNQVPIIAGFNGNEGSLFVHSMGLRSQEELSEALNNYGPLWGISDLETLNDLYSVEVYGDAQEAYDQFYSDVSFVCPTRTFMTQSSAYTPVHGYYYTHVPSWIPYYPSLTGWGSYHTSELSFVFGSGDSYLTAEEIALSDAMQEAWTSLAKGDPEIPNLSSWPLFNEAEGGTWVQFDSSEISVVNGVRKTECDFIDQQWLN